MPLSIGFWDLYLFMFVRIEFKRKESKYSLVTLLRKTFLLLFPNEIKNY